MIDNLKKNKDTYPYPHVWHNTMQLADFIKKYTPLCLEKNKWLESDE